MKLKRYKNILGRPGECKSQIPEEIGIPVINKTVRLHKRGPLRKIMKPVCTVYMANDEFEAFASMLRQ